MKWYWNSPALSTGVVSVCFLHFATTFTPFFTCDSFFSVTDAMLPKRKIGVWSVRRGHVGHVK